MRAAKKSFCNDKKIAEMIIKAQMCSDSGKHIWVDYGHPEWKLKADLYGYSRKPFFIVKAMEEISKGGSAFRFFVAPKAFDWCDIAYFDFRFKGKKYQISFHVPEGIPAKYKRQDTHWDYKSSRDACWILSEKLKSL